MGDGQEQHEERWKALGGKRGAAPAELPPQVVEAELWQPGIEKARQKGTAQKRVQAQGLLEFQPMHAPSSNPPTATHP